MDYTSTDFGVDNLPMPRLSTASMDNYTHNTQPFYGSVDFVRDNPGEPVPDGTFRHLLDFLEQNEDNTDRRTNNLDKLPLHPD